MHRSSLTRSESTGFRILALLGLLLTMLVAASCTTSDNDGGHSGSQVETAGNAYPPIGPQPAPPSPQPIPRVTTLPPPSGGPINLPPPAQVNPAATINQLQSAQTKVQMLLHDLSQLRSENPALASRADAAKRELGQLGSQFASWQTRASSPNVVAADLATVKAELASAMARLGQLEAEVRELQRLD